MKGRRGGEETDWKREGEVERSGGGEKRRRREEEGRGEEKKSGD